MFVPKSLSSLFIEHRVGSTVLKAYALVFNAIVRYYHLYTNALTCIGVFLSAIRFTSAPMSDGFLTLARLEDGSSSDASPSSSSSSSPQRLSCFLVPRWLPNGSKNHGLQFQRLKDKMGDKANASSEVTVSFTCMCYICMYILVSYIWGGGSVEHEEEHLQFTLCSSRL